MQSDTTKKTARNCCSAVALSPSLTQGVFPHIVSPLLGEELYTGEHCLTLPTRPQLRTSRSHSGLPSCSAQPAWGWEASPDFTLWLQTAALSPCILVELELLLFIASQWHPRLQSETRRVSGDLESLQRLTSVESHVITKRVLARSVVKYYYNKHSYPQSSFDHLVQ